MRWLTNTTKRDAAKVIAQLCVGWSGRILVEGDPKATDAAPADYLKSVGMVGIYEAAAGTAIS